MERPWQTAGYLISALQDSRKRTLDLVKDLSDEQLRVPLLPIINPVIWEIGHVGWFQEKWVLRHSRKQAPLLEQADSLWDSAAVAHDTRWDLPLPSRRETLEYIDRVLEGVVEGLESRFTEEDRYFCWLAIMHEDMHGEALTYTRQTLGFAPPILEKSAPPVEAGSPIGDAEFSGGPFRLGAGKGESLVFDNEKWEHDAELGPFSMSKSAVTQGQFAEFVDDGGYTRPEFWTVEGWQWRTQEQVVHPVYWIRDRQRWLTRSFDQIVPLAPNVTLIHVNWYEADAFCKWAGQRLPTEAEWEFAAAGVGKRGYPWGEDVPNGHSPAYAHLDSCSPGCAPAGAFAAGDTPEGVRQMIGNAWEWMSDDFCPYPGFARDPYKEYSEPWFGPPHKVLRGGCWATRSRLIRNTWRNFYPKHRRDVFGGFRTCALKA